MLCKVLGALPKAGGILDQDSYHIWLLNTVYAAQTEAETRGKK
jgi:hypothetical protein